MLKLGRQGQMLSSKVGVGALAVRQRSPEMLETFASTQHQQVPARLAPRNLKFRACV